MGQRRSRLPEGIRRHLPWLVPLVIGVGGFLGLGLTGSALINATRGDEFAVGIGVAGLGLMGSAYLVAAVASVLVVVGVIRVLAAAHRRRRWAKGRFTRAEEQAQALDAAYARSWHRAGQLRLALEGRQVPPSIDVWDVVPQPGETFFFDTSAQYARYYGQDTTYTTSGGFFFGHPLFVAAGVAMTAAGNAARRSAAEAAAQTQWREQQSVRLLVSNQRLVCNVNGQWLSFFYSAMTAVFPEVERWSLVCQFDSTSPLLLSGPAIPETALMTVLMTHGPEAVTRHPSLQALAPNVSQA